MKKLFKKIICTVLTAVMIIPMTANMPIEINCFAADSDYKFDVDSGTITKYTGTDTDVTIPDTIAGYPVKKIGESAFEKCSTITSVTINSNIQDIGPYAFKDLENLKTLTINAGTLLIEYAAFKKTGLENISLTCSDKLTFTGNLTSGVFYNCTSLKYISFPEGTENIGGGMFMGCEILETVVLPNTLKTIDDNAFTKCYSLKNIAIPDHVTVIGEQAFSDCSSLESISIPNSVEELGIAAFDGCSALSEINIGSGLTELSPHPFSGTALKELTLPVNIEKMNANYSKYMHYASLCGLDNLEKLTVMNDELEGYEGIGALPETCVVYCGADSNALKGAIAAGLKYVIIETPSAVPVEETTALVSNQRLFANGSEVDIEAYNINGNNYFKLRDIAYIINGTEKQFGISYNGSTNAIALTTGAAYSSVGSELQKNNVSEIYATPSIATITLDGTVVYPQAYNINGNNYFKLRDLASRIDFGVEYDESTGIINIATSKSYTE